MRTIDTVLAIHGERGFRGVPLERVPTTDLHPENSLESRMHPKVHVRFGGGRLEKETIDDNID